MEGLVWPQAMAEKDFAAEVAQGFTPPSVTQV
jgi:hypothetical protein